MGKRGALPLGKTATDLIEKRGPFLRYHGGGGGGGGRKEPHPERGQLGEEKLPGRGGEPIIVQGETSIRAREGEIKNQGSYPLQRGGDLDKKCSSRRHPQ